jgi:hypothetical protein
MFVTVLGMAIGNLLMTCADIAGGLRKPRPDRIHLSWMILLLVAMLNLFWETTLILDVPDWAFPDFLYVIAGPMILLFATGVICAPPDGAADSEQSHYFSLSPRFFTMMVLQELWLIGIDLRFDGLGPVTLLNGALMALFILLAVSRSARIHLAGNVIAWLGFLAPLPLAALNG